MYGISESGLLLWLGETHAISQRSILQPTRVIIAQHVARRLATFSKKQSVTKSRTILDIFIVLKVFFFFFFLFLDFVGYCTRSGTFVIVHHRCTGACEKPSHNREPSVLQHVEMLRAFG